MTDLVIEIYDEIISFLLLHILGRHQFVNNELIIKAGLVDKRKVSFHIKNLL